MAQKIGGYWARADRLPGIYASERGYTQHQTRDPRCYVGIDDPAESERMNDASPVVIAARRKLAQFDAGQTVRCFKPGLREFPAARDIAWLMEAGVSEILVAANDEIYPAPRHPNALS